MRLHVDSDLGGDPDDACGLTMLLGWPGVEIVGVTTTDDPGGTRAGQVAALLHVLGRDDIPVRAGAEASLTTGRTMGEVPDDPWVWGDRAATPRPGRLDAALDLMEDNIDAGATVVAIGPYSNLAALDRRGGGLSGAKVVAMGGWVRPFGPGLPAWGPERDWNVQCDIDAARAVLGAGSLTLASLAGCVAATLREGDLPALEATGRVGAALARQSLAHREANGYATLGPSYDVLPDDLVNFHWDPVACAVAAGWDGATIERMRLRPVTQDGVLRFADDDTGVPVDVVTAVDGVAFREVWLDAVAAAQRGRD